ncbi:MULTISPECIES: SpoIIE family protein phosphatase [Streptomyces]|uniref:SpoIIE family protein phosphatase n=1 Tax=Streptomyces TaxID=1883 RepID=UPI000C52359B|nr:MULTISPECIES: SpoIIE family protein phosphatase [Streptomyces]PIB04131.1 hypothetical protein B1C81_34500 [Streptomyces sp. HG99]
MDLSPDQEARRIAAVRRYDILDTPPDGAFDRIAALAARLFDAPAATVTIVDTDRVWFKAAYGLAGVTQIGRDPGLCTSTILTGGPLVVPDTLDDPVARAHSLVTGPARVRFYAAAPITTSDGHRLGTVDVLDTRPRRITTDQATALTDLAALVMDELELRLSALRMLRVERELVEVEHAARERAERDRSEIAAYASTLQRTLLPPALPEVPGLEAACHYTTASVHDVGGDFYDVFPLGAGRWAFFLGDVSGRGAPAAALTSLIRYTLRTSALLEPDPCAVLRKLNTALLSASSDGSGFYDVFPLGAGRWAFFLGDVSGRGAPADALTSLIRYTLRTSALLEPDPCAVLRKLNTALLSASSDGSGFCTLVFGRCGGPWSKPEASSRHWSPKSRPTRTGVGDEIATHLTNTPTEQRCVPRESWQAPDTAAQTERRCRGLRPAPGELGCVEPHGH